jgi:segregation and condensation protein A
MDIFNLPISELCDKYIAVINSYDELNLHVAGEFLVMAATLIEIKSRMLLPKPPSDPPFDDDTNGPDPRMELVQRLLEYAKYQEMSEWMKTVEGERRNVFSRPQSPLAPEFRVPPRFGELNADQLVVAMQRVLDAMGAGERQVTSVRRHRLTVRLTMRILLTRITEAGEKGVDLLEMISEAGNGLLGVIMVFLSLLELLRSGTIAVAQDDFCGDIRAFFIPESLRTDWNTASEDVANA